MTMKTPSTMMVMMLMLTMKGAMGREKVEGRLSVVSVGLAGVWGVDSQGRAFYRSGTYRTLDEAGDSWRNVTGNVDLKQLDVGDDVVWAVDKLNHVFCRYGISLGNPLGAEWRRVMGQDLKDITVSPGGHVYGVSASGEVYFRKGVTKGRPGGEDWQQIPGRLRQISAGTSGLWGVSDTDDVLYRIGTYGDYDPLGNAWLRVNDLKMEYVSSAFGNVYGICPDGNLYVRKRVSFANPTGTEWRHRYRFARKIRTVDSLHASVWVTDSRGKAIRDIRKFCY